MKKIAVPTSMKKQPGQPARNGDRSLQSVRPNQVTSVHVQSMHGLAGADVKRKFPRSNLSNCHSSLPELHSYESESTGTNRYPIKLPNKATEPPQPTVVPQYIRVKAVSVISSMSTSSIWRKARDGSFVKPTRLSARITAWNVEAVRAWLAERETL